MNNRDTILANMPHLREIAPKLEGRFAAFARQLAELPPEAIQGAHDLFQRNSQLYWLLGDFLAGGAAADHCELIVTRENIAEILRGIEHGEKAPWDDPRCPAQHEPFCLSREAMSLAPLDPAHRQAAK